MTCLLYFSIKETSYVNTTKNTRTHKTLTEMIVLTLSLVSISNKFEIFKSMKRCILACIHYHKASRFLC